MLANNSSTSTCFAIFEPIKFMCFGSTFSCTHKEFPILRPPSMHTCPANAGTRNPRGLTRSAQDSILQSGWFKLCRRNQIGIMTEIMWTSQRSVRVSVLLMQQDVDIRSYKNSRLQKLLRLLFATPQKLLRDPPVGNHCSREFFKNVGSFGHNFDTRNARKSIRGSKDSYCSLESKQILSN